MTFKNISVLILFSSVLLLATGCNSQLKRTEFESAFEGLYIPKRQTKDNNNATSVYTSFYEDKHMARTYVYGTDSTSTEWGEWSITDGVLTAYLPSAKQFYVQLQNSAILEVDSLGQYFEKPEKFISTKQNSLVAKDFNGIYSMGDLNDPESKIQTIEITPITKSLVKVDILSQSATDQVWNFTGEGRIVNNQIQIDLSKQHRRMSCIMVIRFTAPNVLKVSSMNSRDRFDLMYFCSGGGSLAGDYVAVED